MFAVQPKPAPVEAESPRSHGRFLVPLMLLLAAALCGAVGWWGTPAATKPIAEVQLGERVHAVNPLGAESGEAEPAPATHRRVVFRMEKSGGERIDFELLWPLERIRATGAVPGARIPLSMAELGGSGVAEVLAIGPCPPIARGTGSVVTGRFVHRVQRVLEVETDDGTTIGTTPNHPFWSEATRSYRPIGDFHVGDRVRTRTGQLARLTSITPRDGPTTVHNLTVHGQHVYHVGAAGVLVHNNYAGFGNSPFDDLDDFEDLRVVDQMADFDDVENLGDVLGPQDVYDSLPIDELANANQTGSGTTVLGHFNTPDGVDDYVTVAKNNGDSYFSLPDDVWRNLDDDQLWDANRAFLDTVAGQGDNVILNVPQHQIQQGSYLEREIDYLTETLGYRWADDFTLLAP